MTETEMIFLAEIIIGLFIISTTGLLVSLNMDGLIKFTIGHQWVYVGGVCVALGVGGMIGKKEEKTKLVKEKAQ